MLPNREPIGDAGQLRRRSGKWRHDVGFWNHPSVARVAIRMDAAVSGGSDVFIGLGLEPG
ncbi:hypothetical protein [Azospirillum palustre]